MFIKFYNFLIPYSTFFCLPYELVIARARNSPCNPENYHKIHNSINAYGVAGLLCFATLRKKPAELRLSLLRLFCHTSTRSLAMTNQALHSEQEYPPKFSHLLNFIICNPLFNHYEFTKFNKYFFISSFWRRAISVAISLPLNPSFIMSSLLICEINLFS